MAHTCGVSWQSWVVRVGSAAGLRDYGTMLLSSTQLQPKFESGKALARNTTHGGYKEKRRQSMVKHASMEVVIH